eukprot:2871944-Rhodomonas_salina.1
MQTKKKKGEKRRRRRRNEGVGRDRATVVVQVLSSLEAVSMPSTVAVHPSYAPSCGPQYSAHATQYRHTPHSGTAASASYTHQAVPPYTASVPSSVTIRQFFRSTIQYGHTPDADATVEMRREIKGIRAQAWSKASCRCGVSRLIWPPRTSAESSGSFSICPRPALAQYQRCVGDLHSCGRRSCPSPAPCARPPSLSLSVSALCAVSAAVCANFV